MIPDSRSSSSRTANLTGDLGQMDIYLLDQVMRGRIADDARILDVGCGSGRNISYLLRHGFAVWAVDVEPESIARLHVAAQQWGVAVPGGRFRVGELGQLDFAAESFDVVLCGAVLHFARDLNHWTAMVQDLWRVLAPSGLLWVRLATSIGLEDQLPATVGRGTLPDGTDRFVVDLATLERTAGNLGAKSLDPVKTVLVHGQRSMTTWCLAKPDRTPD